MTSQHQSDVELGHYGVSATASDPAFSRLSGCFGNLQAGIVLWLLKLVEAPCRKDGQATSLPQIEDYPTGYPRYTAFIGSHRSFHIFRRFSNLRTRLLLLKQDKLAVMEGQLAKVDRDETNYLSLASARTDENQARKDLLANIDKALAEYDELLERNQRVLALEAASSRNLSNLRNWVNGNGSVARHETAYLSHSEELANVVSTDDRVMLWLEHLVESIAAYLRSCLGNSNQIGASRDINVYIPLGSSTARLARVLMTPVIIFLLMTPVIICNVFSSLTARLFTIVLATTVFVAVLSGSTKAKTMELIIGGATYTTVLIVFISNTDDQ